MPVAALTVALLLGGTSLLVSLREGDAVDAVLFAAAAALLAMLLRSQSIAVRSLIWLGIAALPLLAAQLSHDALPSTLFTPDRGFLALYPTTYIATLGTIAMMLATRDVSALAAFALLAVWAGFGANLSAALALLAPGLAFALAWATRRPLAAVAPLVMFTVLWNYWLMVQYTTGAVPKDAPVSFASMVRQQADVHTAGRYLYPFAFPGNVWFAWREQVPVARYDLLSVEPRREWFELAIERGAERFLLDGWGPPGRNDVGAFRWADGPVATLTFPLAPASGDLEVAVLVTARGEDPAPAELTVLLNDHVLGRMHITPAAPVEEQFNLAEANVGRVVRAGYNRLSLVPSGTLRIAVHRIRIAPAS